MTVWMAEADEWIEHLRRTGRKPETLRSYRSAVMQCLQHLQWIRGEPEIHADSIGADEIRMLWSTMRVSEQVRRAYIRNLSAMVEFHTGRDPSKNADILYNRIIRDRVFIDDAEFQRLYERADPEQRMIIVLGAFMGLRRGEMQAIRDSDIRGDRLTVHGKGHGEDGLKAVVRIPEPVMREMEIYRAHKRTLARARDDDHLLQRRGHNGCLHGMHVTQISAAIKRLSEDTGIRVTTHAFRRYYATTLYYKTDADLQTVRKLMRHADVSTTMRCYIDASDEREKAATDRLSGFMSGLIAAN